MSKHLRILIRDYHHTVSLSILLLVLFLSVSQESTCQKIKPGVPDYFPYELRAEQEIGLILTGTGMLYGSVIGQMNKQGWGYSPVSRLDPMDVWFLDRPATNNWHPGLNGIREFLEPASGLASMGLIGSYGVVSAIQKKTWSELMTLTMMYMEGLYFAIGGELLIKSIVNRARPYAYNLDLPIEERIRGGNNESFISGNATILFYNAAFISLAAFDLYPDARWPAYLIGGSFVLAELSAFWSVRSGMHFPTDVIGGALLGSATALFINRIHKKGARGLNIMPWVIDKGKGIVVRYRF